MQKEVDEAEFNPTTLSSSQIRVLQYDPDQERLLSIAVYRHAPEVWSIAPSAADEGVMLTVWSKGGGEEREGARAVAPFASGGDTAHAYGRALSLFRYPGSSKEIKCNSGAAGNCGASLWRALADGSLQQEVELPGHTSTIRR